MTHISIVSFDALPLLVPDAPGGIGGAEVRAVTFARGLKRLGTYEIDFILADRPELPKSAEGFQLLPYRKPKTAPLMKLRRSIETRLTGRPQPDGFFKQLDSEIVFCFGLRNDTAGIVRACRESGKKSVVFLTSDRNLADAQRHGRRDRGLYGELGDLCRYSLHAADCIAVQSPFQLEELRRTQGLTGHLIRNPIDLNKCGIDSGPFDRPVALWVGRADTFSKRADLCIEVARLVPEVEFRMVMNNHDSGTFDAIAASAPENVKIIERVPFEEIENHYASATVFINTSSAEGFPNSFLQAAKYGSPIVSLDVDPGDMLGKHGGGYCAQGDLNRMADMIASLCRDAELYQRYSRQAEAYVQRYHAAEDRYRELDSILQTFANRPQQHAA